MCGIIGYIGDKNAKTVLLNGLKKLNYRGYDSAGITTLEDTLHIYKDIGDISIFEQSIPDLPGTLGIGHTRWATHGEVSRENAHPHLSRNKKIAVVHNGIIENFDSLRTALENEGYTFKSETDTEVIAHLIEKYYDGDLEEATRKAIQNLEGTYALAVVCSDEKDKLVAARKGSPLVLGIGENENFASSDIPAILDYTNKVLFLDDNEIATIQNNTIKIIDVNGTPIMKKPEIIEWSREDAEKAGYKHYMLKEIYEQPQVIRQATQGRMSEIDGWVYFEELEKYEQYFSSLTSISIIACGTSYYAGLTGRYIIQQLTSTPVSVNLATEYHSIPLNGETSLTIAITQSGETADTLTAMKQAKQQGQKILAICNVPGSTASRIADWTIFGNAGPEIGVAATKTFITQITVLFLFSLFLGRRKRTISATAAMEEIRQLRNLSQGMQTILAQNEHIRQIAQTIKDANSVFYIGRKNNYPIALEGALKLKEIAYIHAEGFSAGELKHGPFALLTGQTPVIALCPKDDTYEKMISNIVEIKARNAPVIAIADRHDKDIKKFVDDVIPVPSVSPVLSPFLNVVACQLLAYHAADLRDCPIDKPRNLAKSVTVE